MQKLFKKIPIYNRNIHFDIYSFKFNSVSYFSIFWEINQNFRVKSIQKENKKKEERKKAKINENMRKNEKVT